MHMEWIWSKFLSHMGKDVGTGRGKELGPIRQLTTW